MYYMVVIVMAMIHMNGTERQKDLFVYYEPYFYSTEECKNI